MLRRAMNSSVKILSPGKPLIQKVTFFRKPRRVSISSPNLKNSNKEDNSLAPVSFDTKNFSQIKKLSASTDPKIACTDKKTIPFNLTYTETLQWLKYVNSLGFLKDSCDPGLLELLIIEITSWLTRLELEAENVTIGQVVKRILIELSELNWEQSVLETTVNPKYSHAVEMLIETGLKNLKKHNKEYENISFFLDEEVFIKFISYYRKGHNHPAPRDFLKELETEINRYVESLSLNWVMSEFSTNEITLLSKRFPIYFSDRLLTFLAKQNGTEVFITSSQIENKTTHFLYGKKEIVSEFLDSISLNLLSIPHEPETKDDKRTKIKELTSLSQTFVSHCTLFYPGTSLMLPEKLLNNIEEEALMEHAKAWQDMEKYAGKIIIFKATPREFNRGYSIHPGRKKELRVGIVGDYLAGSGPEARKTCRSLSVLLASNNIFRGCILATSNLMYSNFKIRLPLSSELEKIKEILQSGEGKFEYHLENSKIIDILEKQKSESEKMPHFHALSPSKS